MSSSGGNLDYWGMKESVRFLAQELGAEELLRLAGASCGKRCAAHNAIAMERLAHGDRQHAREQFVECVNSGSIDYTDHAWARAYLARMEADPKWPSWIRVDIND